MRLLGITRLSSKTEEADRTERDAEKIRAYAQSNGHSVVAITVDEDISGSTPIMERPDTREWFTGAKLGEWDAVCVEDIDRLSRDVADFAFFAGWIKANRKDIVCLKRPVDAKTAGGRMTTNINVAVAQYEREVAGERRQDKARKLREQGYYNGGRVRYGFRAVKVNDHFELERDSEHAAIVERMASEVISGKSASAVARGLNADGVPASQGKHWTPGVILKILRAPETILDPGTWAKAQTALDAASFSKTSTYETALLLGSLSCGRCGKALYANRSGADRHTGKVYSYYRCYTYGCKLPMISQDKLEAAVSDLLDRELGNVELTERKPTGRDMSAKLAQMDARMTELDESYAAGEVPARAYGRLAAKLEEKREEIESQHNPGWIDVPTGERFRQYWSSLGTDGRRQFLVRSRVKVTVIQELPLTGVGHEPERPAEVPVDVRPDTATSVPVGRKHRAFVWFGDLHRLREAAAQQR